MRLLSKSDIKVRRAAPNAYGGGVEPIGMGTGGATPNSQGPPPAIANEGNRDAGPAGWACALCKQPFAVGDMLQEHMRNVHNVSNVG